jgi:ferredoxin-NADP reductase
VTTHDEVDLALLVRQLRWESDGVLSVTLEDPAGGDLPGWQPGAHVDLHLPGGFVRQYSLSGDPGDRRAWRVAVLREPASRGGSVAVHEQLRAGTVLRARGPRNNFELRESTRYLFVAGGIGITPILPMVRAAERAGADWTLLYGGRTRGSMAFLGELTAYGDKVVTHPQDEAGLLPLGAHLGTPREGTLVYGCGPEPLLQALEAAMPGWPRGSLQLERFRAVEPTAEQLAGDHDFEVEAAASGVTVQVPVGTSIVRALEEAGVFPETSCEEGICGTCETKVVEGEPDHRDSLLSDEERETGATMMICVSRCRGRRLVLDL